MHRHNQHDRIRFVGVVTIAMLVGLISGGRRVDAQSLNDSSTRTGGSSVSAPAIPPSAEPLTSDTSDAPAVSDDAITTNITEDSTAHPASNSSDIKYVPSGSAVVPDEGSGSDAEEASGSDVEDDAVLELPQVVKLPTDASAEPSVDGASADAEDNNDYAAQSGENGQQTADDNDLAATAGQVGTLEDYENGENQVPPGAIFLAPGVNVVRFPHPPLFNPPRPPLGVPTATWPIILPPTSSGPFPSTSPMLMAPRFAAPRGLFPSRGLMRTHR